MDGSRLKSLDALFAQKVLGLIIEDGRIATGRTYPPHHKDLPEYTRSLDAAWEGAARFFPIIELNSGHKLVHAEVEKDGYESMDDAVHPAEALVLACLRAVGVTEEELNACEENA